MNKILPPLIKTALAVLLVDDDLRRKKEPA